MRVLINFTRFLLHHILPKSRMGDKVYSLLSFFWNHRRLPKNKMMFNDYLYKLKTSDELSNPLRVFLTDKEFVKIYIKSFIGDEFNVPTLKILRTYQEVLNYKFPSECVIKPTHMSGHIIIKKNSGQIDLKKIQKWFSMNYYNRAREINYKTLKPKVIVEPIVFNNINIKDYKFFCYKGVPKLISVDFDRYVNEGKNHRRKYLNTNWEDQNFSILYPRYEGNIDKPLNLDTMLSVITKLGASANLSFIRIDIYTDNQKIFIGELTNLPDNASGHFYPASGEKLGSKIIFG